MAAQKKTAEAFEAQSDQSIAAETDAARPMLSDHDQHLAAPSPARALQAGLEAEFARPEYPFTQMPVIAGLVVFCFAAWWALFQVAAAIL